MFLTHLARERGVSFNTVKAYSRDLDEFCAFLGPYYGIERLDWGRVDRLAMRSFLAHLTRRGLGKRSIARALSAVRTFYAFLHRNDVVEVNPARTVGSPKAEKYLPGYLDRKQVETLFQAAATRASEGHYADVRNLAILELFYSAGLRLSETARDQQARSRLARGSREGPREGKEGAHRAGRAARAECVAEL